MILAMPGLPGLVIGSGGDILGSPDLLRPRPALLTHSLMMMKTPLMNPSRFSSEEILETVTMVTVITLQC